MTIEYAPRKHLRARLMAGWRMIADHDYNHPDYAILMVLHEVPEPITAFRVNYLVAKFQPKPSGFPNRSAGAASRQLARGRRTLEVA